MNEVYRLTDLNGDGDALDAGEKIVWADERDNPRGLSRGAGGVSYVSEIDSDPLWRGEEHTVYQVLDNRRWIMQILVKVAVSIVVILVATGIAKKLPSTAGLIGVMPLTGALILVWVYLENKGNAEVMQIFTKGALWGILPSILFFLVALFCFKKQVSLPGVLASSFGIWLLAAIVHQWVLR